MTSRTVMNLTRKEAEAEAAAASRPALPASRTSTTATRSQRPKRPAPECAGDEEYGRRFTKKRKETREPAARALPRANLFPHRARSTSTSARTERATPRPRSRYAVPYDSDEDFDPVAVAVAPRKASVAASSTSRADSAVVGPDADDESGGALLARTAVTVTGSIGLAGERIPRQLTARLAVYRDHATTCRLRYLATFHLDAADSHSGSVQVAEIEAWRILRQEDWAAELHQLRLLDLDYSNDERAECARLVQTLFETPRTLHAAVSTALPLLDSRADLMHVEKVFVYNAWQKRGLCAPVLQAFRRLLTSPALPLASRHPGIVLLTPGKFIDKELSQAWGRQQDAPVTRKLTAIYRREDAYEMVVKDFVLSDSGFTTTVLGRLAVEEVEG